MRTLLISGIFIVLMVLAGCKYRRGEAYVFKSGTDSTEYLIASVRKGAGMQRKLEETARIHRIKEDSVSFIFIGDSADILKETCILLFSSKLPDVKNDLLSGGFMGAFGSRQVVTYVVVQKSEFEGQFVSAIQTR